MNGPLKGTGFWRPAPEERAALREHLLAELPVGHVLWPPTETLRVEARDRDGGCLLVSTGREQGAFAVVHMTWAGRPAMAAFLPETEIYDTEAEMLAALREADT
ncbi:hypothetical protein MWU52_12015 [Jannaschia sp. S6380]|uniref:hypothetical protein n=1 Tax=Jannaschia sp. S6380 TaxID=2926408 RepID=UPI001FF21A8C|nr:hypothetical protein [Jannaschia sp. S6380]MCK0168282.1 hypothetical protein [Jannaschia sp. S6380]